MIAAHHDSVYVWLTIMIPTRHFVSNVGGDTGPCSQMKPKKKKQIKPKDTQCFTKKGAERRVGESLQSWQQALLIPNTTTSWLVRDAYSGLFFCSACKAHAPSEEASVMPLASSGMRATRWTKLQSFRRHQSSFTHQRAAIKQAKQLDPTIDPEALAPEEDAMKSLLQHIRRHKEAPKATSQIGRHKLRRQIWCLAESSRQLKLGRLEQVSKVALHHDASEGVMYVNFSASLKLQRAVGFLAATPMLKRTGQQDSVAIAQAIKEAVVSACILKNEVPFKRESWHRKNRFVHEKAIENLQNATFLLDSDAAGDEKKAQEILDKGQLDSEVATGVCVRAELAEVEEFFPRLLGQHEDNAHASTRLTQRGWAGVPELKECYMMMVGSPTSPCRILQSSEQWQKTIQMFASKKKSFKTNLSYTKALQCTDSTAVPSRW